MNISAIDFAPDYPFGQTPGTGSGYLVNNVSGYAIGATVIAMDAGAGTIEIGDYIVFAGHTTAYRVAVALTSGSLTLDIGLDTAIVDNAIITVGPTWVGITDYLEEDLEPGLENIIAVRMGEGGDEMDGVEFGGSFLAIGANLPTPGVRTWLRMTGEDNTGASVKIVGGGEKGCRIRRGKSSIRPLGSGENYNRIEFSATGGAPGSTVETDRS